jgi:hypothetical protein
MCRSTTVLKSRPNHVRSRERMMLAAQITREHQPIVMTAVEPQNGRAAYLRVAGDQLASGRVDRAGRRATTIPDHSPRLAPLAGAIARAGASRPVAFAIGGRAWRHCSAILAVTPAARSCARMEWATTSPPRSVPRCDPTRCAPIHCSLSPHSLSVPSRLPESAVRPSGENATERTQFPCPAKLRSSVPFSMSHSLKVK